MLCSYRHAFGATHVSCHFMRCYYCFSRSRDRNYWDRDLWIGLYHNGSDCSCATADGADCEACRASWTWYEGTTMGWWTWSSNEPTTFDCGRLTPDAWASTDCVLELKYVCERGLYAVDEPLNSISKFKRLSFLAV